MSPELNGQFIKLVERAVSWLTAEIGEWKSALNQAWNVEKPRRGRLQRLYRTALTDGHLTAAVEKRQMRVTGQSFRLVNADGTENEELTALFKRRWFLNFMEEALTVVTHGACLIVLTPPRKRGELPGFKLVPREHYVPESKAVIEDLSNDDRLIVLDQPQHEPWCMHLGNARELGLLYKAVPYVVFKNASSTAWAEYADLFGQPIRKATVPPNMTAQQLMQIDQQLEKMGRSAYIRLPNGVNFDLTSASGRSGIEVFKERGEYCNHEMSKLVEGQTMTSDQGSSKSQGEVHEATAELYMYRDRTWLEFTVNEDLLPILAFHGFKTEGVRLVWADESKPDFEKQLQADRWLVETFDIDPAWFAEKYGAPIKGFKKAIPAKPQAKAKKRRPAGVRGAATLAKLQHSHPPCGRCSGGRQAAILAADPNLDALRQIIERIARDVHSGTLPDGVVPPDLLLNTGSLYQTAIDGEAGGGSPDWNSPDQAALEFLRSDAWEFAGARSTTELAVIRDLLIDGDGKRREWSAFRQEVLATNKDYFEPWLRTEFDHAQVSAVAASQWLQIDGDKDVFPNLRYETVGDDRVREAHEGLDGIIRPVDDPFWDTAYPPNGWRCRCDVSQEDDMATLTSEGDANAAAELAVGDQFRDNVGKSLSIFPAGHPYFDQGTPGGFKALGLPGTAATARVKFADLTSEALDRWHSALPEHAGQRQATVGGRMASVGRSIVDALIAGGEAQAAAPLVEAVAPAEVWAERSEDSVILRMIWFTDGKATTATIVCDRESVSVADISRWTDGHVDTMRKGVLSK